MRKGFTTGSCAAAAAKAAACMLLSGQKREEITIKTPDGTDYRAALLSIEMTEDHVTCAVEKDGGDDPDVTTGALIFATVSFGDAVRDLITIEGGAGVGRVTKPGLDQPVGNAAINSVPRRMIEAGVQEVKELYDWEGELKVVISVPGGEALAKKTFNESLGIEGGISILGTSGIVEPMSTQAVLDTIRVSLRQRRALGEDSVVIAPGNYGADHLRENYGFDMNKVVKCSNYIGDALDMAGELGFEQVLLCGHMGKLIKLSGGIMNTHSKVADCRMELMACAALEAGMDREFILGILSCVSTDAAYEIVKNAGMEKPFMDRVMERIMEHLEKRVAGRYRIECLVFSNVYGVQGKTEFAERMING